MVCYMCARFRLCQRHGIATERQTVCKNPDGFKEHGSLAEDFYERMKAQQRKSGRVRRKRTSLYERDFAEPLESAGSGWEN